MTPTNLLKTAKLSGGIAFTLASALLLGACSSAAGAAELESAQAQLTTAQAELDALLYALQVAENGNSDAAESDEILPVDLDEVVLEESLDDGVIDSSAPIIIYANDIDRFEFKDITYRPYWQQFFNRILSESLSTYSQIYDGKLVWGNFGDEGVLIHFEGQYAIEGAEIADGYTLVVYVRPDGDVAPNRFWEVIYFEDGGFMNLFVRIEHLTIINADTNTVMFSHQIHHGHPAMGVSSLAELRAYLGLD